MDLPLALYAWTTGMMAAFNPCGLAMLPAYFGYALARTRGRIPLWGAFVMGLGLAAGAISLFIGAGIALAIGLRALTRWSPFLGLGIGGVMVLLALSRWRGSSWAIPGLSVRGRPGERPPRWWTWVGFGLAYGAASLGCTLPLFLALVGLSLSRRSGGEALLLILFYGLGMGGVLVALTLALAVAGGALTRRLRSLAAPLEAVGVWLLLGAGLYLIYYWGRTLF